jgi:antitoxin MazE
MVKNLVKHGNSYALIIDKPILELLEVTPDTDLELTTNGDRLIISPVRTKSKQARLNKIIDEVNQDFAPALKKLAE